jgi:ADP-heptose:LPS heptosyltransferase
VAHLATALRRPSVLLFGPMPPSLWGPRRDLDRHVVLWAGRRGDALGDAPDPGLLEISAADVIRASERLGAFESESEVVAT